MAFCTMECWTGPIMEVLTAYSLCTIVLNEWVICGEVERAYPIAESCDV